MSTSNVGGKLTWKAVGATDIGGGKENQDDCFVWENPARGLMVIGVLDGHGRDVGKVRERQLHYIIPNPMRCCVMPELALI